MELRYLKLLKPERDVWGSKTGKYVNHNKGLLLQFKNKKGEWEDIEEVSEVREWQRLGFVYTVPIKEHKRQRIVRVVELEGID